MLFIVGLAPPDTCDSDFVSLFINQISNLSTLLASCLQNCFRFPMSLQNVFCHTGVTVQAIRSKHVVL